MDYEIAPGKRARHAYSFDDIAIVPSRRTRTPEDVSTSWQIDAYKFDLPLIAAPMDSVVSPETAIAIDAKDAISLNADKIELGTDAKEALILGNAFKTWMENLIQALQWS